MFKCLFPKKTHCSSLIKLYFSKLTMVLLLAFSSLSLLYDASKSAFGEINVQIGGSVDPTVSKLLPNYNMVFNKKERVVSLSKLDGSAKAFMQVLSPAAHLSTTKSYAQYVMDSYAGWGLKAQIARRGFSFLYADNAPCSALVTYFDGASYLMYGVCGFISEEEMIRAFSIAKKELGIDEIIYRSSLPSIYY